MDARLGARSGLASRAAVYHGGRGREELPGECLRNGLNEAYINIGPRAPALWLGRAALWGRRDQLAAA